MCPLTKLADERWPSTYNKLHFADNHAVIRLKNAAMKALVKWKSIACQSVCLISRKPSKLGTTYDTSLLRRHLQRANCHVL